MFTDDNKKILRQFITVSLILLGLLTGGMTLSQNSANASHVRHARTKNVAKRTPKRNQRTKRAKVQHRYTKAVNKMKRTKPTKRIKSSRKLRKMIKYNVKRRANGHKKLTEARTNVRPMKIEHRSTSKDPVHVTPDDHE